MEEFPKIYAAYARDEKTVLESSSGGIFTILSDYFLKYQNPVVCSLYEYKEKKLKYILCKTPKERDLCRGSKYFQSDMGEIIIESKEYLHKNPESNILVVGTPCQVAGMQSVLEQFKLNHRVVYCELICHGVPSPKFFDDYVFTKNQGKFNYLTFKNKENGWNNPTAYIQSGKRKIYMDDYIDLFYQKYTMRPSCYECPYAQRERFADLTIGDYWGIHAVNAEFHNNMGTSVIFINTKKGLDVFEEIKDQLVLMESDFESCVKYNLQPNLLHPATRPIDRDKFWQDYIEHGIKNVVNTYSSISNKTKLKKSIKRFLKKFL